MKPKLLIHCGLPKTGTTSLQDIFAQNEKALLKHGWLYPQAGRQGIAHHPFANFFRDVKLDWVRQRGPLKTLRALKDELSQNPEVKNILISSETLFTIGHKEELAEYFSDYDIQLLVFLRRQDEWLESVYREQVKNGAYFGDPESYIRRMARALDYDTILTQWEKTLGKDNIQIEIFEPQLFKEPLEHIFFRHLGLEFGDDFFVPERRNDRLNRAALNFMINLPQARRVGAHYGWLKGFLQSYSVTRKDAPEHKYIYSPGHRIAVVERHQAGNERIAQRYFGTPADQMFKSPMPSRSEVWAPFPGLDRDQALELANEMWSWYVACEEKKGNQGAQTAIQARK